LIRSFFLSFSFFFSSPFVDCVVCELSLTDLDDGARPLTHPATRMTELSFFGRRLVKMYVFKGLRETERELLDNLGSFA